MDWVRLVRDLARIFQALSDVNRIRILKMLEKRSLCVCEITAILELATSTVSKHLSVLRNAGFITDAKEGKWINYSLIESPSSPYINRLLPLVAAWLPDDGVVMEDAKKVHSMDRDTLCG